MVDVLLLLKSAVFMASSEKLTDAIMTVEMTGGMKWC